MSAELVTYIRGELEARGWSQTQLAIKSNLDKQVINNLLQHPDTRPELVTLERLAAGLNVSLVKLLFLSGYDPGEYIEHPDLERIAILLEAMPDAQEVIDSFAQFSASERSAILAYIRWQLSQRDTQ